MVMGKVSKAIAASFLCLSLFNASGDFASAMQSSASISKKKKLVSSEDALKTVEGEDEISNQDKDKGKDNQDKDKDKDKEQGKDKDKDPDDKKGLSETTMRVIIGVSSGVGGAIIGFLLGKFAL